MGILDTRERADALCTVIALGVIISSKDELKNHSYIIYEDGTGSDAERRRHFQLRAKLVKLENSNDLLAFKTQSAGDKSQQPLILAQTNRSVLQGNLTKNETVILNQLERKVNEFSNIPLRGAYVGGLLATEKTELLDPSILYWYKPEYRTFSPEESDADKRLRIEESYRNAEAVTETVRSFLNSVFPGGTLWRTAASFSASPISAFRTSACRTGRPAPTCSPACTA